MPRRELEATRIRRALDAAGIGFWEWSADDRLWLDDRLHAWLEASPPTMAAYRALVDAGHRARVVDAQEAARALGRSAGVRYRIRGQGGWRWLEEQAVSDGERVVGACREVTQEQRRQQVAAWRATHDGLTGLHDRAAFLQLLRRRVRGSASRGVVPTVIAIDLDQLKSVNDELGHRAGDRLLALVGRRLRTAVRSGDVVARLGGDEFAVALMAMPPASRGWRSASACWQRCEPSSGSMVAPCSCGRAPASPPAAPVSGHSRYWSGQTALERADRALYQAKLEGGDRWVLSPL